MIALNYRSVYSLPMFENGETLRKMRDALDLSTMEIAVEADLHPQTVNRVFLNDGVSRKTVHRVRKAIDQFRKKLNDTQAAG